MIIPDLNVLIYAHDQNSPHHTKAKAWWENCLSGSEPVGLPLLVLFGFMRIATNPHLFSHAMTPTEAARTVRSWLEVACLQVIEPDPRHIERVLTLLEEIGTAGDLVTDAQIAALAIQYGAIVHTADADFLRFAKVRWLNPLTGVGN
ncbi:MAG: type II toxin-antitoxin system VapC family toxin [Candidatus Hydrogenedentes bacterium]|nr:type II toxin-antitoxin system VapC family toxin [Candidatus Hydrogenedentota bacterium]